MMESFFIRWLRIGAASCSERYLVWGARSLQLAAPKKSCAETVNGLLFFVEDFQHLRQVGDNKKPAQIQWDFGQLHHTLAIGDHFLRFHQLAQCRAIHPRATGKIDHEQTVARLQPLARELRQTLGLLVNDRLALNFDDRDFADLAFTYF